MGNEVEHAVRFMSSSYSSIISRVIRNYCAVRKIGDTSIGTAQSGGEPERGGGPPLSVGVRGEGRALALCRVQERGPSPRTEQRGGRCSHYSALRSNSAIHAVA